MNTNKKITFIGLFIWFIALLFYIFECFLRVFPNTLADNLITSFNLNAEEYSYIGSAFFISYAFMQLPVGILINKFGVKKLLIIASSICSVAVFWFSVGDTFFAAILSRLLMGFASAFGFITLLALALNWFPQKHFGFFSGLSQFVGSIGPVLAGGPLALILVNSNNNWRLIFLYIGLVAVVITILIAIFVKNKPRLKNQVVFLETPKSIKKEALDLLKKTEIWWIILFTGFLYCSMPILGTYWGILFLQAKGFDKSTAAFLTSIIWIGYAVSSPIVGKISDMTRRRVPAIALLALLGCISSIFLLFYPTHNYLSLALVFFSIGTASSGIALSFAIAGENVRHHLQTTAFGLTNMILMFFAAIIPSFIGAIIHSKKNLHPHIHYTTADFVDGLMAMPILYFLAFLIAIFCIKETFCRSQYEVHHVKK